MTLQEGLNILRVDPDGGANDTLIQSLIDAIPDYIKVTTGMSATQQKQEALVKTVSGFILTMWYYADHADDMALKRTIDNLLKCITLKVDRSIKDGQEGNA